MKRLLSVVLLALLFVGLIPFSTNAKSDDVEITYFQDGSYLVTEIVRNTARASGTVSGSKPSTYYNNSGVAQWKAVLNGTFSISSSGATCTSASMNVTIYDSSWHTVSKSATKSGNMANGSATIGRKVGGVTVASIPVNLTLSCDKNGNLS